MYALLENYNIQMGEKDPGSQPVQATANGNAFLEDYFTTLEESIKDAYTWTQKILFPETNPWKRIKICINI